MLDNNELEKNVAKAISLYYPGDITHLDIKANKGWIYLEGFVSSMEKRNSIQDIALNVFGTCVIINKITIVPTGKSEDISIADKIIDTIDSNVELNVDKIIIEVRDHVVKMTGKVPNFLTKQLAYNVASGVENIRTIENQLKVMGK